MFCPRAPPFIYELIGVGRRGPAIQLQAVRVSLSTYNRMDAWAQPFLSPIPPLSFLLHAYIRLHSAEGGGGGHSSRSRSTASLARFDKVQQIWSPRAHRARDRLVAHARPVADTPLTASEETPVVLVRHRALSLPP